MARVRLHEHFGAWKKKEKEDFKSFMEFYYPNKKKLMPGIDFIIKQKSPKPDSFKPQKLKAKVYTNPISRINDILTEILNYVEEYIFHLYKATDNKWSRNKALLNYYFDKEIGISQIKKWRNNEVILKENSSLEMLNEQVQFLQVLYYHDKAGEKENQRDKVFQLLIEKQRILDSCHKLELSLESFSRANSMVDLDIYEITPNSYADLLHIPLVKAYDLLIKAFKQKLPNVAQETETYITGQLALFDDLQKDRFLDRIRNLYSYFSRENLIPAEEGSKKLLSYYQQKEKYNRLILDGVLPSQTFNNIINLAANQGKINWGESFINKYKTKLKKGIKVEATSIAQAELKFAEGKYEDIPELIRSKCKNLILELRRRSILLNSCIEGELDHELDPEMEIKALKANVEYHYKKQNLSQSVTLGFINYLILLDKLIKQETAKSDILEFADKNKTLFFRSWLNKKIQSYQPFF